MISLCVCVRVWWRAGRMTAGTVVITGGILATVILLCIIAVLCYCRLQVCAHVSVWACIYEPPELYISFLLMLLISNFSFYFFFKQNQCCNFQFSNIRFIISRTQTSWYLYLRFERFVCCFCSSFLTHNRRSPSHPVHAKKKYHTYKQMSTDTSKKNKSSSLLYNHSWKKQA